MHRNALLTLVLVAVAGAILPAAPTRAGHVEDWDALPARAYPGDHVFVPMVGGGHCYMAMVDPARSPTIRKTSFVPSSGGADFDEYHYQVTYWLVQDPHALCGLIPFQPRPLLYLDVGSLPRGSHHFTVTGSLEDQPYSQYTTNPSVVRDHLGLPADMSGLWHDPAQRGRGLVVMRTDEATMMLYWATHDREGRSTWVLHTSKHNYLRSIGGAAITTDGPPLSAAASNSPPRPWGQLKFTHLGCGKARFEWTPLDSSIAPGSQSLVKLTQSYYEPKCAPTTAAIARWLD